MNVQSAELLASLRQELAEAKDTLNEQVKETVQWKTMEAVEVNSLNQVIRILKEKDAEVRSSMMLTKTDTSALSFT